jgi:subtilisin
MAHGQAKDHQQFLLLPSKGVTVDSASSTASTSQFFRDIDTACNKIKTASAHPYSVMPGIDYELSGPENLKIRVLDSLSDVGPKLVSLTQEQISALRARQPGVRVVPIVYYEPALAPRPSVVEGPTAAGVAVEIKIRIQVVSSRGGTPIEGAKVIAFLNFEQQRGDDQITDDNGNVDLNLGGASAKLERLYIYHDLGFWRYFKRNVTLTSGMKIKMVPVDVAFTDLSRHLYGTSALNEGAGLKVGVIDTGVAPHSDLLIDGGACTVSGEDPTDFGDNGEGHGTHVAGIIAARGTFPNGIRGIAPGVTLRSYRVYPKGSGKATNVAVTGAILRAMQDGCDLLNMSLEASQLDPAILDAVADARSAGILTFASAGNGHRKTVSMPAASPDVLAVSAMGRRGTWPRGAGQVENIARPFGTDPKNFIADFSNVGPELDLTGPGVGVISTFPGGYAAMDGTSMACPAVVGMAARTLAARPDILGMARDLARAEAMQQAVLGAAHQLGFGATFEGQGIL